MRPRICPNSHVVKGRSAGGRPCVSATVPNPLVVYATLAHEFALIPRMHSVLIHSVLINVAGECRRGLWEFGAVVRLAATVGIGSRLALPEVVRSVVRLTRTVLVRSDLISSAPNHLEGELR